MKKKMIKCPTCEKEFNYYSSESRPFCTDRCKMIDLGHWFEESYSVPSETPVDDLEGHARNEGSNGQEE
jgi:uncharacterized protein